MSTWYTDYLLPAQLGSQPTAEEVEALILALLSGGFVDVGQMAYRGTAYGAEWNRKNYLRVGHLASDFASLSADADGVVVQLPTQGSRCDGLEMYVSKWACIVPPGETGGQALCSSCGADLAAPLDHLPASQWAMVVPQLEGRLQTCPSCRTIIDLSQVTGRARRESDGAYVNEPSPLFRLAVAVMRQGDNTPESPEQARDAVERSTASPFKRLARW